ncbi:MAG: alpha/beta fold hydrolase, partial [Thermoleophilaceae bacterium]
GIADNADALAGMLVDRGVDSAIVAGHSWGAGVAIALAERHPQRVRRLVLVNPVTPGDRLGPLDRVLAERRVGPPLARAAFATAGSALGSGAFRRALHRTLPGYGIDRSAEVAREWRSGDAWRSFYVEQRALFTELPALRDGLADLVQPTTIVIGERDRVTDPAAGRRFAAEIGARLVEVPRAGHLLPMQSPGHVADAIAADQAIGLPSSRA